MSNKYLENIGNKLRRSAERHKYNQEISANEINKIREVRVYPLPVIELKSTQGEFNGHCNITRCQAPLEDRPNWYNHSTLKYYCQSCAFKLNAANRDALTLFGHELCTKEEQPINILGDLD